MSFCSSWACEEDTHVGPEKKKLMPTFHCRAVCALTRVGSPQLKVLFCRALLCPPPPPPSLFQGKKKSSAGGAKPGAAASKAAKEAAEKEAKKKKKRDKKNFNQVCEVDVLTPLCAVCLCVCLG